MGGGGGGAWRLFFLFGGGGCVASFWVEAIIRIVPYLMYYLPYTIYHIRYTVFCMAGGGIRLHEMRTRASAEPDDLLACHSSPAPYPRPRAEDLLWDLKYVNRTYKYPVEFGAPKYLVEFGAPRVSPVSVICLEKCPVPAFITM